MLSHCSFAEPVINFPHNALKSFRFMFAEFWLPLAVIFLCLATSFFFSASETALTATSRATMHILEDQGNENARTVNQLLDNKEHVLGAILIGNNISNTAATALTTGVLLSLFGSIGIAYATVVISILIIVFAEILPKTAAILAPDKVVLFIAAPLKLIVSLFGIISSSVTFFVNWLLRKTGIAHGEAILSPTDEIRGQIDLLHSEGGVVKDEKDMLGGLLDLNDLETSDVMVHRTKMRSVCADNPPGQIIEEILAAPYTRMPLWKDSPDNIIGVLHVKDLLRALIAFRGDTSRIDVQKIAQEPWFILETTTARQQLQAFLARKKHFALVIDEYGEVQGLVTLEDILEEIVGDIKDEHDLLVQSLRPRSDGSIEVEGSMPIRDCNRLMNWNLTDEAATTIAGLIIDKAHVIPDIGQVFHIDGFRFEVMRKNQNRITAVRIQPL